MAVSTTDLGSATKFLRETLDKQVGEYDAIIEYNESEFVYVDGDASPPAIYLVKVHPAMVEVAG